MIENRLCKIRRIKISNFEKVETAQGKYKIIVRMYPFKESKSKIFIDDSELTRIIKHLNPQDNCLNGRYVYLKDLISIKVGKSGKYKMFIKDDNNRNIENIGELEIHNYAYDKEKGILSGFYRDICASDFQCQPYKKPESIVYKQKTICSSR